MHAQTYIYIHTHTGIETRTHGQRLKEPGWARRQTERETLRKKHGEKDRERKKERERDRDRKKERERDRERKKE